MGFRFQIILGTKIRGAGGCGTPAPFIVVDLCVPSGYISVYFGGIDIISSRSELQFLVAGSDILGFLFRRKLVANAVDQ